MAINIRFKAIVDTLANIATDKFQGRLAWATNIARMIWYYDANNYGEMARRDVLETFANGIQDSTLTNGQALVAGASGRIQSQDAATFRGTIDADDDLTRYGGVGDDSTDNTSALASSVADGQVIVPPGKFRISTEIPANQRGVPMRGAGSLMVPVDQADTSKGYHRYPFVEDDGKPWFGMEYLYPLHKAWKDSAITKPKIYMAGDSTIAGSYITEQFLLPHNALLTGIRHRGFEAEVINKAVPGNNVANFDAQMSDAEIDAATCILVSFGINDTFPPPASWTTVVSGVPQVSTPVHASLDAFIDAYRAVLQRIRSRRNELECAIVIKTSNAVSDTQHKRDETQAYAQRRALRKLARDWKCTLIDIPMYVSDVRPNKLVDRGGIVGPTGEWSGTTPVQPGWMDDPFRTDANYYDPNAYWCAVHPLEVGNIWIWGVVADALCQPAGYLANNHWVNAGTTQAQHSWAPSVYGIGATTYRAFTGDGWPLDGFVHTIMDVTGNGIQYHYNYGASTPQFQIRIKASGDTWSAWIELSHVGHDHQSITVDGTQRISSAGAGTFASLQASNLSGSGTRPLVADASGNIDDQDAATFRATIGIQSVGRRLWAEKENAETYANSERSILGATAAQRKVAANTISDGTVIRLVAVGRFQASSSGSTLRVKFTCGPDGNYSDPYYFASSGTPCAALTSASGYKVEALLYFVGSGASAGVYVELTIQFFGADGVVTTYRNASIPGSPLAVDGSIDRYLDIFFQVSGGTSSYSTITPTHSFAEIVTP